MAAQISVEWQVLLEDDAWNRDEALPQPREATVASKAGAGHSLAALAGTLCLLLMLAGYALWNTGQAMAVHPSTASIGQAALSADRLAAKRGRSLNTEHLRINARGSDVAAVVAMAEELDAFYVNIFAAVGVQPTHGTGAQDGRFVVFVQGTETSGWHAGNSSATLPSPSLLPAPTGMADRALLRQSWAIALADQAAYEAGVAHRVPVGWRPLLGGLRLWLLWDAGGPLAESREEIVRWRYAVDEESASPDELAQICQTFALWHLTPLGYSLPLACGPAERSGLVLSTAPDTLAELGLPEDGWSSEMEQ
jgi:hypothetical protein